MTGSEAARERPVLITGGAGFVGCNLAHRLCSDGRRVIVYDNLSRPGVERNLAELCGAYGEQVRVLGGDVRDAETLANAVKGVGAVFHFAAQVAVTSSLDSPRHDFEVNALGTLNLLEVLRVQKDSPVVVFTSTNKVYGGLDTMEFQLEAERYEPRDEAVRAGGIPEAHPLDFHSPYGCSKGAADQYTLDYARTFGLRAAVFRMSCIYGPRQCGTEDQGWVAHFLLQALQERAITLYGDGRQVRDVLFVEDLVDAFLLAEERMDDLSGQAFNIGGGVENTTSLLELLEHIDALHGNRPTIRWGGWRPGDQRYYVSDISRFRGATGWSPKVGLDAGLRRLYRWLCEHRIIRPVARREATLIG